VTNKIGESELRLMEKLKKKILKRFKTLGGLQRNCLGNETQTRALIDILIYNTTNQNSSIIYVKPEISTL